MHHVVAIPYNLWLDNFIGAVKVRIIRLFNCKKVNSPLKWMRNNNTHLIYNKISYLLCIIICKGVSVDLSIVYCEILYLIIRNKLKFDQFDQFKYEC